MGLPFVSIRIPWSGTNLGPSYPSIGHSGLAGGALSLLFLCSIATFHLRLWFLVGTTERAIETPMLCRNSWLKKATSSWPSSLWVKVRAYSWTTEGSRSVFDSQVNQSIFSGLTGNCFISNFLKDNVEEEENGKIVEILGHFRVIGPNLLLVGS